MITQRLETETVEPFASVFLAENTATRSTRPKARGLVVMDRSLSATKTSYIELHSPILTLTEVGHYHTTTQCGLGFARCPATSTAKRQKLHDPGEPSGSPPPSMPGHYV
jgi:hypothetical protein